MKLRPSLTAAAMRMTVSENMVSGRVGVQADSSALFHDHSSSQSGRVCHNMIAWQVFGHFSAPRDVVRPVAPGATSQTSQTPREAGHPQALGLNM